MILKDEYQNTNQKHTKGFTFKYEVNKLVYFEELESYNDAYTGEKQLKKWKRIWKLTLIEKSNPEWNDLSKEWFE